ncbi:MFS efflux transporter aclA [Fusarium oxysporum f. sp. albedinis]|nr:MFS efflux transporter aclA [Fusarium oxysporum f. sp. albedinis]
MRAQPPIASLPRIYRSYFNNQMSNASTLLSVTENAINDQLLRQFLRANADWNRHSWNHGNGLKQTRANPPSTTVQNQL